MKAHIAYLRYVLRHKWFVLLACRRMNVPIIRAVLHDWDKFLPDEWFPYVHTFYAPDGSKQYVESPAFAQAWNIHQKRNKHHWQHWLITWDRGITEALPMPTTHIREMVADWIGAGQAISGQTSPRVWYKHNQDKMILHPETRAIVETLLNRL